MSIAFVSNLTIQNHDCALLAIVRSCQIQVVFSGSPLAVRTQLAVTLLFSKKTIPL